MKRKNAVRKTAAITSEITSSVLFVPAWRIPKTRKNMPTADSTAPIASNGRVGSAGSGSSSLRLRRTMIPTTIAWKTKAARQLIAEVITPPISGPRRRRCRRGR